ncbi:tripartite tricarboxylate transporter substrate binding protein [Sabulicella glaciei]|uniref:Tripartite tricarboxylate transporter substrate binding protein n=1 Tax=Sabulicella glaciei TaxID=2984948 RepID=A0ABT3P230_9PROT|nr:tripartite tricarboxylate transporter substrate binding protein [Roseococcus sp. MDT2-1-1]MCW8088460.1 tripartite tricarboxylate transporter substrate binding protein [Roseococcus sp. MDT2-1-1]
MQDPTSSDAPPFGRRAGLALAAASLTSPALAQQGVGARSFPSRPVRVINPFAAGGATDTQLRSLCDLTSARLGQPVLVENRAGAGGTLAAQALLNETRPDGHLLGQFGTGTPTRWMMSPRPPVDPMTEFTWVAGFVGYLFGVVVRADAPLRSWADLVAHARANPGQISYGTPGVGTPPHLAMEVVAQHEGLQWTHVPFRGGAEVHPALLGGQIAVGVDASTWAPLVDDGRERLLVTFAPERSRRYPEVPTLREAGVPHDTIGSYGIVGPPGLDRDTSRILHAAFREALLDPGHRAVLERYDMPLQLREPEECAAEARRVRERDRALLERLGLRQS